MEDQSIHLRTAHHLSYPPDLRDTHHFRNSRLRPAYDDYQSRLGSILVLRNSPPFALSDLHFPIKSINYCLLQIAHKLYCWEMSPNNIRQFVFFNNTTALDIIINPPTS